MSKAAWMIGFVSFLLSSIPAVAQVTSDNSTGTIVAPNGNVFEITGGTAVGGRNLFHSFDRFDVPTGGSANFLNDPSIVNIFSRVTGGRVSEIDGVLRSNGTANFFLMNPNGIVFGENASLDVGGSFVATTANGIQFGDRGSFSASASPVSDVLVIDPSALLFNSASPTAIEVRSQEFGGIDPSSTSLVLGLRVPDEKSLVLAGGDIRLQSGNLYAFDGSIELGGLSQPGTIALSRTGDQFQLQFPDQHTRSNVTLTNATASVRASGFGTLRVYANNLNLTQRSALNAGIAFGLTNITSQEGGIKINAQEQVNLSEQSTIASDVDFLGFGNSGNVEISTRSLSVTNGASITTSTRGVGNAGNILINVDSLTLSNQGLITSSTFEAQDAGNITINAVNNVVIENGTGRGRTGIDSSTSGAGKGGNISISGRNISIQEGAGLRSSTSNITTGSTNGDAGDITLIARERFTLRGSKIGEDLNASILALSNGQGKSGNVSITAPTVEISDAAFISTVTAGEGKAGDVTIDAKNQIALFGSVAGTPSFISSAVDPEASGKGGTLTLTTGSLSLLDGATLSTSTLGSGAAGEIDITARDSITIRGSTGSGIASGLLTDSGAQGAGGGISINARSVFLEQGGQINSTSQGSGIAGDIMIDLRDRFQARNGQILTASANSSGGAVTINARSIRLLEKSNVATAVLDGNGKGGSITFDADTIVVIGRSDILAFADLERGQGGNILFRTNAFIRPFQAGLNQEISSRNELFSLEQNSRVDVNASGSISGEIIGVSDITFLQNGLAQLPQNAIDTNALLANSCIVRNDQNGTFFITGTGGLPTNPGDLSTFSTGTVQPTRPNWKQGDAIVEPQGVYQLPNGDLVLSREC